ncbi:DUF2510 domain-containing protein [Demequina maris]|uniref:DUF2510 domain-containing protein n=1 Tax=Demequina maris TaxID=1638982 RepID=UPI000782C43C|nr:DUF2510 domain-containing protein [Demequina maris]
MDHAGTTPPAVPTYDSASATPAGWYADPVGQAGLLRYWDGSSWTAHTHASVAPPAAAPKRRLSAGAIIAIVVGAVLAGIVLIGILAAIAIPLYLQQQQIDSEAAAQADLVTIAVAVSDQWADRPWGGPAAVREEGDVYVIRQDGANTTIGPRTGGTHLGGYESYGDGVWCVWVESADGNAWSWAPGDAAPVAGWCPPAETTTAEEFSAGANTAA